ncbi:MAG: carbon-nitrogen hydrolase family protein [Gammaproteobacteria bacterium]|nr:carbon-nitrogen hydrolase family protein [Gammaproteobacteria bacterium]
MVRTAKQKQAHVDDVIQKISDKLDRFDPLEEGQEQVDLVVLPELSTIEYSRETFSLLPELAETLDGPSVEKMLEFAVRRKTAIVFGMPRISGGRYYISQIAISAEGELLGCYDKLHICQYGASMEKEYFDRGSNLSVFSIAGFVFAPIICYDIRIPELSRTLTLKHKVDCILHCGAYFRDESFSTWHAFATTRSMENQIYMVSLNRAGSQYGESIFCPPWVDDEQPIERFSKFGEDFRFLTINRSEILEARAKYTFLQDRLENYESLNVWSG